MDPPFTILTAHKPVPPKRRGKPQARPHRPAILQAPCERRAKVVHRFAEDDRFYYALRTVAPVRVLVVDGDPGTSLFDSEVFYLLSALQPSGALRRPLFYPKPVTWEGLGNERLTDYQVIVLCNVEALEPQVITAE